MKSKSGFPSLLALGGILAFIVYLECTSTHDTKVIEKTVDVHAPAIENNGVGWNAGSSNAQTCVEIGKTTLNKIFCIDNTQRTWTQAKSYCESLTPPMTLATIDVDGVADGDYDLLDRVWSAQFHGWYWTEARIGQSLADFRWGNGKAPELAAFGSRVDLAAPGSCLSFYSKPGSGKSHGIIQPCDATNGLTLCQRF